MAEPLALALLESIAVSADGASTAVEISGRQRVARLTAEVSAISVEDDGPLVVTLQRRVDSSAPWETTSTATITAAGAYDLSGAVGPLTRVSWTLDGTAAIAVRGTRYTVYAEPSDLSAYVAKAAAFEELSARLVVDALVSASDEADGYLGARYTMPITAWTEDLRKHVAAIATATVFNVRGADPQGPDALIYDARTRALQWLDRLQAGRLAPQGIVDSTPTTYQAGIVVASRTRRGW